MNVPEPPSTAALGAPTSPPGPVAALYQGAIWLLLPIAAMAVALQLAWGLVVAAVVMPWLPQPSRNRLIKLWSRLLLLVVGTRLRVIGAPIEPRVAATGIDGGGRLLVANHVSWLDVYAIDAVVPSRFIAKSEITRWPVVGWLVTLVGTLFLERGRRHAVATINRTLGAHLALGESIAIFPEGTTTDGSMLLRFHANLIQPALDHGAEIRPVAISYTQDGEPSPAAAYIGDMTLVGSILRVLLAPRLTVTVEWLPPVRVEDGNRHAVGRVARQAIAAALDLE